MLAQAAAWLDQTLKASEGEVVSYRVGGDSLDVTAVVGGRRDDVSDDDTGQVTWQYVSFYIMVADLVLHGERIRIEPGQRIVRTIGGRVRTYLVMPNEGDNASEPTEEATLGTLRIKTKLISDEPEPE